MAQLTMHTFIITLKINRLNILVKLQTFRDWRKSRIIKCRYNQDYKIVRKHAGHRGIKKKSVLTLMVNVNDGAVCLTVFYLPGTNQHCFVTVELLFPILSCFFVYLMLEYVFIFWDFNIDRIWSHKFILNMTVKHAIIV